MKKTLGLLAAALAFVGIVWAQSTTVQTINTVPTSGSTFLSDLQNFLREEDADRYAQQFYGMVVSGGTHATGAGLTKTPAALTAYVNDGHYITETGAITYPDADTCWVIASATSSGNLGTFTRVSGTKYLLDCASATKPALPSGTLWLMEVTTAGSAVTVVTDLRTRASYAGTFLQAELPAAGTRGRLAFVRDSGSGAMFFDNGSAWASVGISNPMTTAGDLIYGGVAGVPTRTPCATASSVLQGGAPPACTTTPSVSTLTTSGQGAVQVGPYGAGAGATGEARFLELATNGTNYVGFKSPDSIAANRIWTLPSADGSSGQSLATDGSGALSFATPTTNGLPRVVGAIGVRASTTTYTVSAADMIAFYKPGTKTIEFVKTAQGTLTADAATQGRNGRDQAGAFTVSTWVYLYYTYDNGATNTPALRLSAVAPPTGPTLANSETSWAFIAPLRWNGASNFENSYIRGSRFTYITGENSVLSTTGTAAALTSVDLSVWVPPQAVAPEWFAGFLLSGVNASGADVIGNLILLLSLDNSATFTQVSDQKFATNGGTFSARLPGGHSIPNSAQLIYYTLTRTNYTSSQVNIYATGYRIANGN